MIMTKIIKLEEITFIKLFIDIFRGFKVLHFIIATLVFILLFLNMLDLKSAWELVVAYLMGVVLSVVIHEWGHIYMIKKLTSMSKIKISTSWYSFSIEPLGTIRGIKSIIIACAGPTPCLLIAVILSWIHSNWRNTYFLLTSLIICYAMHCLSFWPTSGDGLMIVKGLVEISAKGGD